MPRGRRLSGSHKAQVGRMLFSAVVAFMLIATGLVTAWVLVTSGMFAGSTATLDGPLAPAVAAEAPIQIGDGTRVLFNAQLSQPRDPFRPLIGEGSPTVGQPGVGGTGDGFDPGTSIVLVDVRDVNGVFRATVTVNGVSFDVGVGDTFAGRYQVVSLSEDSGVFTFGDSAFTLAEGQQILK